MENDVIWNSAVSPPKPRRWISLSGCLASPGGSCLPQRCFLKNAPSSSFCSASVCAPVSAHSHPTREAKKKNESNVYNKKYYMYTFLEVSKISSQTNSWAKKRWQKISQKEKVQRSKTVQKNRGHGSLERVKTDPWVNYPNRRLQDFFCPRKWTNVDPKTGAKDTKPKDCLPIVTSWWLNQPIWKICSSNRIIIGVKIKKMFLKPPPSFYRCLVKQPFFMVKIWWKSSNFGATLLVFTEVTNPPKDWQLAPYRFFTSESMIFRLNPFVGICFRFLEK